MNKYIKEFLNLWPFCAFGAYLSTFDYGIGYDMLIILVWVALVKYCEYKVKL